MLHIDWIPTGYISYNRQNWTSPWFERIHLPHILGPVAVTFIEHREILVEDASILCHGTE